MNYQLVIILIITGGLNKCIQGQKLNMDIGSDNLAKYKDHVLILEKESVCAFMKICSRPIKIRIKNLTPQQMEKETKQKTKIFLKPIDLIRLNYLASRMIGRFHFI